MPPFVLTVLKITFLILLYYFVYRSVRTIAADMFGAAPRPRGRPDTKTKPVRRQRGESPGKLIVTAKDAKETHKLSGQLRIGRDASCEIRLADTYASQQHARIYERDGAWVVEDLGSTNGTYLNRKKLTVPTQIAPGDKIRIGNTYLEARR